MNDNFIPSYIGVYVHNDSLKSLAIGPYENVQPFPTTYQFDNNNYVFKRYYVYSNQNQLNKMISGLKDLGVNTSLLDI